MTHTEPGSLTFAMTAGPTLTPTITAVSPVNRAALQNYIANIRQSMFHGAQVPFRVIHVDAETGRQQEEHVPGCATCSL